MSYRTELSNQNQHNNEEQRSPDSGKASSGTRRIDLIRSLRWAGSLCTVGFAMVAYLVYQPPAEEVDRPWPYTIALIVPAIAWTAGRFSYNPTSRQSVGLTLACGAWISSSFLPPWLKLVRLGHSDISFILLAAFCAALTLTLVADLLLCRHADSSGPDPEHLKSWRPGRPTRRTAGYFLGATALLTIPVLALSHVSPSIGMSVTAATPPEPKPEAPSSVTGEVAWSRALGEPVSEVLEGSVGPILVMDNGAIGLDGTDGTTLWSYRTNAYDNGVDIYGDVRIVISPDGAHITIMAEGAPYKVVIIESSTGEVIAENPITSTLDSLQMTDHVVLAGTQAYSLTDGSLLWELEEDQVGEYVGSVGHNTLIIDGDCRSAEDHHPSEGLLTSCTMSLIDDTDPTNPRSLDGVVTRPREGTNVIDGWVIRYSEGTQENIASKDGHITDDVSWPLVDGKEMEAINIDTITTSVEGAAPEGTEVVPLGVFAGPAVNASNSLIPLRQSATYEDPTTLPDSNGLPVSAVFDPSTRSLTEVAAEDTNNMFHCHNSRGCWPTPDTGVPNSSASKTEGTISLSLTRTNGADPITIEIDHAISSGGPHLDWPAATRAPGAVVLWTTLTDGASQYTGYLDSPKIEHTVLYGVR